MNIRVVTVAIAVAGAGCLYEQQVLVPARHAGMRTLAGGDPSVSVERITISVQGETWRADPPNLSETVTPLFVRLENDGDRTLRVRYSDFVLVGSTGLRYRALPLFWPTAPMSSAGGARIELASMPPRRPPLHVRPVPPFTPRFHHHHFFVAPHFGWVYPRFQVWILPFPYEPGYFQRYYEMWSEPLPTPDMFAEALPEGALEPGGEISGFLYFQHLNAGEREADFRFQLVDATTGERFGEAEIPLAVR